LKKLKDIPLEKLRPAFQKQLKDFIHLMLDNPRVKKMFDKPLNGRNLADLADDISKEDIPVLKSAYINMCQNECLEALNESEIIFD
jgi:hypothetical protein